MKLIEDWKVVLKKAWSIKLILIAGFFSGLEFILPMMAELVVIPNGTFALLAFISTNAAFVTRVMAQKEIQ